MKSTVSLRQQLHLVLQILNVALVAIIILYQPQEILAQARLTPEDAKRLKVYAVPNEFCHVTDDPKVLPQLKLLLGKEVVHLLANLSMGYGCDIENGWLRLNSSQPHDVTNEQGFVGINLENGDVVTAIFSNPKFNVYGITRPYSGDLKTLPGPLAEWIKETWTRVVEIDNSWRDRKKIDANAPPNVEFKSTQPMKTATPRRSRTTNPARAAGQTSLSSARTQGRLPFVGTRTFCGEHSYWLTDAPEGNDPELRWKTKTTVTIRKNGFTAVKTNAYGPGRSTGTPSPYLSFSGKLSAGKKGEMHDTAIGVCDHPGSNPTCLSFLSATHIIVDKEESADEGDLCTSNEPLPTKRSNIQQTLANPRASASNRTGDLPVAKNGQTRARVVAPPTESGSKVSARSTASASNQTYIEVPFEEVEDLEGLAIKFPVLKEAMDETIAVNKDPEQSFDHSTVYVAYSHQTGQARMLLLMYRSMSGCGTMGCPLSVYVDQGSGFKEAFFENNGVPMVYETDRFYVSRDQLSLVMCLREYRIKGNTLEEKGIYNGSQELKWCVK